MKGRSSHKINTSQNTNEEDKERLSVDQRKKIQQKRKNFKEVVEEMLRQKKKEEEEERERQEKEKREKERQEKERQEKERQEKERQEKERQEKERKEKERKEKERQEKERQEKERQERERQERERQERERKERERQEREREKREKERERLEKKKIIVNDNKIELPPPVKKEIKPIKVRGAVNKGRIRLGENIDIEKSPERENFHTEPALVKVNQSTQLINGNFLLNEFLPKKGELTVMSLPDEENDDYLLSKKGPRHIKKGKTMNSLTTSSNLEIKDYNDNKKEKEDNQECCGNSDGCMIM